MKITWRYYRSNIFDSTMFVDNNFDALKTGL